MKQTLLFLSVLILSAIGCSQNNEDNPRNIQLLDTDWYFQNHEVPDGEKKLTNPDEWQKVKVPHDWAISGDFDEMIDAQNIMVVEDGEKVAKFRTGRTGGLPHIGIGWYQRKLDIPRPLKDKRIHLEFDGAMSHSRIYVNEKYVGEWPYGYASFGFDITDFINSEGDNFLAVRLENKPSSSRWYPGAGIYRNVRMVVTNAIHIQQWGTCLTTPDIAEGIGTINLETIVLNHLGQSQDLTIVTEIINPEGMVESVNEMPVTVDKKQQVYQKLSVESPILWSVEDPRLYKAVTHLKDGTTELDRYETSFGFRYFEFTNNEGFFLNGKNMKLNGVCMHHDLGPLGSAINESALRRQLEILQEMGCNAIRTSHNPPAPELLNLSDEMGFLIIDEAFDEWKHAKLENGYHTLWDDWAEKDLVAMIHRDRNHPSVIMWSIGNEIREQGIEGGEKYCQFLVDICKREDPTRPTTAGFNDWQGAIKNGFANIVDVPGWNYKPQHYEFIHEKFPAWTMYGSETASTVSSRGEYFFPAEVKIQYTREPYHCSSYDMEYPHWATSPDTEFAAQDSCPYMAGEFVWTGFDYLGEPTPYNIEWPSRSSYFGIIDLCGIPKDRYYLYQSNWTDKEVLHLLPHWNWEGKEGEIIPVHCYTSFRKAELFLNGKSLGIQEKDPTRLYRKYRLVWDVPYEAGELKVVALDETNQPLKEATIRTAGEPAAIKLEAYHDSIKADGKELAFITVSVVDNNGTLCPTADNLIRFKVEEGGNLVAVGNGDPTSLESFVKPQRQAFNGQCMVYVQNTASQKDIRLTAGSVGLEGAEVTIKLTR
jgi:beta-galactosidase